MNTRKCFVLGVCLLALLSLGNSGCTDSNIGGTVIDESKKTEENQQRLRAKYPLPKLDSSLELENLVKRLERINRSNRVAYVYCLSSDGHVIASWVINGKISSLNSLLTTPEQPVTVRVHGDYQTMSLPSPDFDGSYGSNPNGNFFFDVRGQMTEVVLAGGMIICTETPMKINTPVSLSVIHDPEEKRAFQKKAQDVGVEAASKQN